MMYKSVIVFALFLSPISAQILSAFMNLFSNIFHGPEPPFGSAGHHDQHPFFDDGTQQPQATGFDDLYPADCGRNPEDGTGKLCFPDGLLCRQSKIKTFKSTLFLFLKLCNILLLMLNGTSDGGNKIPFS